MNEMTLKMAKKHVQERLRKRMAEQPEDTIENFVDAVCLDCINFRLMLDGAKDELLGALGKDLDLLDKFLGQVEDDLLQMIEEDDEQEETDDE